MFHYTQLNGLEDECPTFGVRVGERLDAHIGSITMLDKRVYIAKSLGGSFAKRDSLESASQWLLERFSARKAAVSK